MRYKIGGIKILEQITELNDKSVSGYSLKAQSGNGIVSIICKMGSKKIHSYKVNVFEWRAIEDNGKLHFNRLLYLDKKVPQLLFGGISNIRSKIMDAEVRLIIRIINE